MDATSHRKRGLSTADGLCELRIITMEACSVESDFFGIGN
jgi:hypothetical protein